MTKTSTDVVSEALRRIRVLGVGDTPAGDDATTGKDALDALFAELNAEPHAMGFTWTVETVPDAIFRPLAWLLAVDLAQTYQEQAEPRSRAMMRLRAYAFPDDRDDRRDLDDDGTVTTAEIAASERGAFF